VVTLPQSVVEGRSGRVSYAETGVGPPRLILHSLLTDRRAFDPVADGLGGRVIAMDLPGFGATAPASPAIDSYSDRVADFVEALALDSNDLTLIGNGLGAFVALGAAIRHPELASRLILVGCGVSFSEDSRATFARMADAVRTGGMEAVVPTALLRIFTESYLSSHPGAADERSEILRQTDPEAFITACNALRVADYSAEAPTVAASTLILVGEDDGATPPWMAEELHNLVPDSRLVKIPGVAHAPQLQDPGGFLDAVSTFLET
jgi:3-oxoadipate enol-lactonase